MAWTIDLDSVRKKARKKAERRVRNVAATTRNTNVRRFLRKLAPRVLDHDLTIESLITKLKLGQSFSSRFRKAMGETPWQFIRTVRAEIAVPLVDRGIRLVDVVDIAGFDSVRTVRKVYKDLTGTVPSAGRLGNVFDFTDVDAVERLTSGEPTLVDLHRLQRWLDGYEADADSGEDAAEIPPKTEKHAAPEPPPSDEGADPPVFFDGEKVLDDFAEHIVRQLDFVDVDLWENEIRRVRFPTPALYERLHQRARDRGREDRKLGVRLARLAWLSVETSRRPLRLYYPPTCLEAISWHGNSLRLSLDLLGAEEVFKKAEAFLKRHPALRGTAAEGKFYALFGTLRAAQGHDEEARQLMKDALKVFEGLGDVKEQVLVLNQRATMAFLWNDLERASADLRQALRLLKKFSAPALKAKVLLNQANCQVRQGRGRAALETLRDLRKERGDDVPSRRWELLELWVEGAAWEVEGDRVRAEEVYRRAVRGFDELGERLSRAQAQLDLALLLCRGGASDEASRLASEAMRTFRAFELGRETNRCLDVLRQAVAQSRVREAVLRSLRDALRADPLVEIACPADR